MRIALCGAVARVDPAALAILFNLVPNASAEDSPRFDNSSRNAQISRLSTSIAVRSRFMVGVFLSIIAARSRALELLTTSTTPAGAWRRPRHAATRPATGRADKGKARWQRKTAVDLKLLMPSGSGAMMPVLLPHRNRLYSPDVYYFGARMTIDEKAVQNGR
jgi:hypothetical protein